MSTFTKLKEGCFSATERRIADYILQNADCIQNMTISTVAKDCNTSKSMVVQLCKAAGFTGYKDLCSQLLVEKTLSQQQLEGLETYEDIHPGCSTEQILQITAHNELLSLQSTISMMDTDAMAEAVELLLQADRIVLFGVGGSAVCALDMHNKLCRIGLNSRFSPDVHCQLLDISSMTEKSVGLVFSFCGRTRDMIDACEMCRDIGAKVISITRHARTPVGDLSHIRLSVACSESIQRITAMSSRLSTMLLVDLLFTCLANRMADRITDLVHRNSAIASRRRK